MLSSATPAAWRAEAAARDPAPERPPPPLGAAAASLVLHAAAAASALALAGGGPPAPTARSNVDLVAVEILAQTPVRPSPAEPIPPPVPAELHPAPPPSETAAAPAPALAPRRPARGAVAAPPPPAASAEAGPHIGPVGETVPREEAPARATPAPAAPRTRAHWRAAGLRNAKPRYPYLARRRGQEGRVLLEVRVTADGGAASVLVRRSSGYRLLDEAARDGVRSWRFVPARAGGGPVADVILIPIAFRLDR